MTGHAVPSHPGAEQLARCLAALAVVLIVTG
jgi:hypothetical protein